MKPFNASTTNALLHWDYEQDPEVSTRMHLRSRMISDVRVSEVAGGPCRGWRNAHHTARDKGDYVGVVCKMEGDEICTSAQGNTVVRPGDMLLWRNRGELAFRADEWTRKLILLVPATRFETVLRKPFESNSLLLPGNTGLGTLTASFMVALSKNMEQLDGKEGEIAVEMALDLVGLLLDSTLNDESSLRTTLYERVIRYIDRRLEDADLTPAVIAAAHGISRRYLHLIFAQQGETVSGWIRERRLLRCREELQHIGQRRTMTEIAHRWGYSDSAHFSRSFKKRFGMPPRNWRDLQRQAN